jgi:dienelactone hydrolase
MPVKCALVPTPLHSYFSQTLQGADILAAVVDAQVFMPDFFGEGNAFNIDKFPIKDEETQKELGAFVGGVANPSITATRLVEFVKVLRGEGFNKIGALGYCWGNSRTTLQTF